MSGLSWWIVGTGMLARKVMHAIVARGDAVAGFADEAAGASPPLPGRPVVALRGMPSPSAQTVAVVAIGHGATRRRLMEQLAAEGWTLPSLVHPRAWVAPDARLDEGVFVAAGAVIESNCHLGRGVIADIGALVDHECRIAPFAHLRAPGALGPRADWPGEDR